MTDHAEANKREAELEDLLAQGPPLRGCRQAPLRWLFEPESFAPMARICAGQHHAIVCDHLGTPVLLVNDEGRPAWSASLSGYGELRNLNGERWACPFRWPGQYEDLETGLHYNRFRYYDAEAGQYASQDPIGLAGGAAVYGYVVDPLSWTDPLGLSGKCAPRRTKHVENRHINRAKYPGKSKYRKPSQVDKLNAKTLANPDTVVDQDRGRVRYEKRFGREIGTRGETVNVVVVDAPKNKVVTSFPTLEDVE